MVGGVSLCGVGKEITAVQGANVFSFSFSYLWCFFVVVVFVVCVLFFFFWGWGATGQYEHVYLVRNLVFFWMPLPYTDL